MLLQICNQLILLRNRKGDKPQMSHFRGIGRIAKDKFQAAVNGTKGAFCSLAGKMKNNPRIVRRLIAPVLSAVIIAGATIAWAPCTLALEVNYKGQVIGCISDKSIFSQAMQLLKNKLSKETAFYEEEPQYTVRVTYGDTVGDAQSLTRAIAKADGSIVEATGLYVDGELCVISRNSESIKTAVENLVLEYQSQVEAGRADIDNEISLSTAYYNQEKADELSLAKKDISDLLTVKVVRTEVYTNEIAYTTNTVTDDSEEIGYSKVTSSGQNGVEEVTEEISFVNGVEVSREVVSKEVVSEPVERTVVVGSKSRYDDPSYYASAGGAYFSWPVTSADFQYISAYWGDGRGHKAVDFAAQYGGKVLASADGTVSFSGWYDNDYGYTVIIDHGDGYQTLYAHCSSVGVVEGQKVSSGQRIASVGSTGRSTGPHVHFEVRIDGVRYNPAPFLGL